MENITVEQLREVLGIGRRQAYLLVSDPSFFPSFKIGKRIIINTELLRQWIEEQGRKGEKVS